MTGSDSALLLRDFVNTLDVECGMDELATPAKLGQWLTEHRLPPARPGEHDLATARTLREGLRAAMLSHHMGHEHEPPAAPEALEEALGRLPLRVSLAGNAPSLVPLGGGASAGLGGLAAAIMTTAAEGNWRRLKVCQEDTCRWAFLDTSKNRSRAWCSMQVCGNRTKTRAYRARHRPPIA